MTSIRLITAALTLFIAWPSFAQDWIDFVDRTEKFAVNFPGNPAVKETTYLSEDGKTLPAKVYTAQEGDNRYSATVVNLTILEPTFVRGSIAYAAWNFRKRGGEVTYDAFAQVDRIEGHQLQITNRDKSRTFVAIHLHARRLYILEATVPPGWPPPGDFQQSLSILDDEGKRIRYNLDADGNRTTRAR